MPDYSKGKIYELYNKNTNEMIYIGSTIQPLYKRLGGHKYDCKKKNCPIYKYIKENNIEYGIRLIENFPCNNKEELLKKEGEKQREYKDKILNVCIAGRTDKEYREDNKDKIKEKKKEYHQENKDEINKKRRKHRKENKDEINKILREKKMERINCGICQKEMRKDSLNSHIKTIHKKQRINCQICQKELRKDSLIKHNKSQHTI